MATVTVTTSTTSVDSGASGFVRATNTGTVQATLVRGTDRTVLWPGSTSTITPAGVAVTATTPAGTTTLDVTAGTLDIGLPGASGVAGDDLSPDALSRLGLTFDQILAAPADYTYDGNGDVATETIAGVTTTFTYNVDHTVATATRAGVTRTFTYTSGNLTGVA